MCAIDSVDITRETALNLTLNKGELNPYRDTPNLYSSQYADVLKFDMTILKCDTSLISPAEEREIIDWLTSPLSYSLLTIDDDDITRMLNILQKQSMYQKSFHKEMSPD